eukprot:GHUV01029275.1.p1 GENE.GHUV01029275.1~~GHUV01029275.1.p1  ORF type:complete len:415 (+),score=118.30 GHUV01029275.1:255-1499(+)
MTHCGSQLLQYTSAMAAHTAATDKRVVICGGGIIGAATAYYLAQLGVAATVVEREAVAAAASGKAGGFLAFDWNDGSPVGPLARHSYMLHAELAKTFGRETIGYREVDTIKVTGQAVPSRSAGRTSRRSTQLPDWLDGNITACSRLGSKANTAQVHPQKLTTALMNAAQQQVGAKVVIGTVAGITTDSSGAVTSVKVSTSSTSLQQSPHAQSTTTERIASEQEYPADAVVLAMGPWTGLAQAWLPTAPCTSGQKYHSIVLKGDVSDTAVFPSYKTADGRSIEPELYPRPDGTVYVCGEPQAVPVPAEGPSGVTVDTQLCSNLKGVAASLSSQLASAPVEAQQACYLPLSEDGLPVIGKLPGVEGAYVATGHSCWGILNGPATGQAIAELIVCDRAKSVDITELDPARLVVVKHR